MAQTEVKEVVTRIQHKIDTVTKWDAAEWVPLEGEMIIYTFPETSKAPQVKFGDGKNIPRDLPFSSVDVKSISVTTIDALLS